MKLFSFGMVATFAWATALPAQLRVETGGGQSHLDQLPASSLTALGGSLDALLGPAHLQFSGQAEDHIGLGMAGVMSGGLHYRFTPGAWRVELGPVSDFARDVAQSWTGTVAGEVRAERELGSFSVRGGWQQGVALDGMQSRSWFRPSLGADLRLGALQVGALWQMARLHDSVFHTSGFVNNVVPGALLDSAYRSQIREIHDLGMQMAWSAGPFSLSGRVGRRFGLNILPETFWDGRAVLHLTPIMALTVRAGRLASDALLQLRGGQYATLGLQLDLLQRARPSVRPASFAPVEFLRESPSTVQLSFVLPPGTRHAALEGDLTEWKPVELARGDDGRWQLTVRAPAGVYRLNIRTDGGPWRAPVGLPATEDGFGTTVGLLVVDR